MCHHDGGTNTAVVLKKSSRNEVNRSLVFGLKFCEGVGNIWI